MTARISLIPGKARGHRPRLQSVLRIRRKDRQFRREAPIVHLKHGFDHVCDVFAAQLRGIVLLLKSRRGGNAHAARLVVGVSIPKPTSPSPPCGWDPLKVEPPYRGEGRNGTARFPSATEVEDRSIEHGTVCRLSGHDPGANDIAPTLGLKIAVQSEKLCFHIR